MTPIWVTDAVCLAPALVTLACVCISVFGRRRSTLELCLGLALVPSLHTHVNQDVCVLWPRLLCLISFFSLFFFFFALACLRATDAPSEKGILAMERTL